MFSFSVDCPPGTSSTTTTNQCAPCPVGSYQNLGGQLDCNKCPEEFTTEMSGTFDRDMCSKYIGRSGGGGRLIPFTVLAIFRTASARML